MNPDDLIKLASVEISSEEALAYAEELERFEKTVVEDCTNTCDERVTGHCTVEDQLAGRCAGALRAKLDCGRPDKEKPNTLRIQ
jgi:hypothetical protein